MKSYTVRVLAVIAALSLAANVLLYFRYSTSRPLATVGSAVITKKQFQDQLEHDQGQTVLSKLVFTSLVSQAASRAGMMPTQTDIDNRIKAIQRQSPQLLTPYAQDAAKMAQFREDLGTSMALENLRIQNVALTPAQIAQYYASHRRDFALPQQTKTLTVVTDSAENAATAADLLRSNDPPDVIGRQPGLRVIGVGGYEPDLQALSPQFKRQMNAWTTTAGIGAIKTFQSGSYFLTFRINGKKPEVIPPLSDIRGEVERAARLQSAPTQEQELARLYRDANPTFSADRYAAYFSNVRQYPADTETGKKTAGTH